MNKVTCDECQHEYELTHLNTNLKEQLPNNIERYYIECPNCKAQYTSYYQNDELKKVQAEILRLQKIHPLKIKQKNKLVRLRKKIMLMHNTLKAQVENME
ncbi:hypothetical protein [Oceanobacillus kimchii]|uniref:hypothetical protein n=1 Tax=Oceanobacillus kimchii TaxID=746691 RepID=UPI00232F22D7|nr:hypothetical protein [Oceanobacillus kimchii]